MQFGGFTREMCIHQICPSSALSSAIVTYKSEYIVKRSQVLITIMAKLHYTDKLYRQAVQRH